MKIFWNLFLLAVSSMTVAHSWEYGMDAWVGKLALIIGMVGVIVSIVNILRKD